MQYYDEIWIFRDVFIKITRIIGAFCCLILYIGIRVICARSWQELQK